MRRAAFQIAVALEHHIGTVIVLSRQLEYQERRGRDLLDPGALSAFTSEPERCSSPEDAQ